MEEKKNFLSNLCGFFWIKNSGIPYFKWFSDDFYYSKWNQEDLFFTGFFSALNSSAEVFFEGIIKYIDFGKFRIFNSHIKNGNIFALITTKDCSDSLANALLNKMISEYHETDKKGSVLQDQGDVEKKFIGFIEEISKDESIDVTENRKIQNLSLSKELTIPKQVIEMKSDNNSFQYQHSDSKLENLLKEIEELQKDKLKLLLVKRGCAEEVVEHLLNYSLNIRVINNVLEMMELYGDYSQENLVKVFRLKKINLNSGLSDLQEKYLTILKQSEKPLGLRSLGLIFE